jgi:flagellar biogenesis protein FliO
MLQQCFAVFLVLALLLAALWFLRRQGLVTYRLPGISKGFARRNHERRLRVIERLALTPQHSLHLVSLGDQMAIFVTSPAGCERVDTVPQLRPVAPQESLKSGASC